ncbi:MAG TPA: hypothetical protein PKD24_13150 [Pyrinomonadaceae bacterium]|nr:hypothetical protein [Pyrinomonadaceae bacterium]HMP67081.1 hypothetical protein [Pyrinomonadaceae bacterium]
MAKLILDIPTRRMLLADWFRRLASESGLDLSQHSSSRDVFSLGSPTSFNVRAEFIEEAPYLRFAPSDSTQDDLIAESAAKAAERVAAMDLGGEVWYSTELHELPWSMSSTQFMGTLVERLNNQRRIVGWRRLGGAVLLEFTEQNGDHADGEAGMLAPKAVVKVYVAAPGPVVGQFSSRIAHAAVEVIGSICTFALGRPINLPHAVFPARQEDSELAEERRADSTVLTLAREGVPLDIYGRAGVPGGFPVFQRLRSALLTYDAAVKQEHDAVACILYVASAECLTTPDQPWRTKKLTKRFRDFYDELIPDALDRIVQHGNFEEAIGVRRGNRTSRALRREALEQIYSFRSGRLHEGLVPSYRGLYYDPAANARRGLFRDFAGAAILGFIQAPRSSLIGHPMFAADGTDVSERPGAP